MATVSDILERTTQNKAYCHCPICGHTKESTCEYLFKKKGWCKCCVSSDSKHFEVGMTGVVR